MSRQVVIAVVSWNTRELLRACLESLAPVVDAGLAEVWVVDNASADGSPVLVREEFGWARLIASEENLGFGRAVNEVASRTESEWIAPANADIELRPGGLERMLAVGRSDRAIGAVAPRLLTPAGGTQHSVHAFPTVTLAVLVNLGLWRLPGLGERLCIEGRWDPDRARRVDWAHGAFLLVRRAAFEEVAGFDPGQWLYAEDIDLQWRLARAGWTTRYDPSATVRHRIGAATTLAFGAGQSARHLAASYAWLARRRGITVAWACALLNTVGAAGRWLALALAAMIAPDRFATARDRAAHLTRLHARGLRGRAQLFHAAEPPPALSPPIAS